MADRAALSLLPKLQAEADSIIKKSGVTLPSTAERDKILGCFRAGIPAEGAKCIADVVNAGWSRRIELPDEREAFDNLNDLVLKTIEVQEYGLQIGQS
jgi:hypothetical protein